MEDPPSSKGSADYHPGQTHSMGEECISKPTLQEGQSSSHRMYINTNRSGHSVHHVGHTEHRSIRHTAEESTSGIRVPHARFIGTERIWIVDDMGRGVCIRISSFGDAGTSTGEDTPASSLRNDAHRSQMAKSVLVR